MKTKAAARVLSRKVMFRGPIFHVTRERVQEPGNIRATRDVVRHQGSVVVLAVDDSHAEPRVLLERQYRHAAARFLLEVPAGRIDAGETALAAGKRELIEETGFTATRWKKALTFWASPGFLSETMTVLLATGLRRGQATPEADENIAIRFVPLSRALRLVMRGTIRDAKSIVSILWLARELHR